MVKCNWSPNHFWQMPFLLLLFSCCFSSDKVWFCFSLSIRINCQCPWVVSFRVLISFHVVRSLLSSHKFSASLSAQPWFEYLCDLIFFLSKLSFPSFRGRLMSTSVCLELTCDGLVSRSEKTLIHFTVQKPEISTGSMGRLFRKRI